MIQKVFRYLILISLFCLQLGEHCSELKDIHLGQCYSITDEGMVALARGCPKLQRLYLQENKLVSTSSLIFSVVISLPACLRASAAAGAQLSAHLCLTVSKSMSARLSLCI